MTGHELDGMRMFSINREREAEKSKGLGEGAVAVVYKPSQQGG